MRRDPTRHIFDAEASDADDVTQEFWGSSRGWLPRSADPADVDGDESLEQPTSAISVLKSGLAAFRPQRIERASRTQLAGTRQHGVVRARARQQPVREATIGELASAALQNDWEPEHHDVDHHDVDHYVELSPLVPLSKRLGLGAVDPLLMRLGMIVLIGVTLVPFAMALRPSDENALAMSAAVIPSAQITTPVDDPATAPPVSPAASQLVADPSSTTISSTISPGSDSAIVESEPAVAVERSTTAPATSATAAVVESQPAASAADDQTGGATASVGAERLVPECVQTYEAGSGDSWYRIADEAGVSPSALMAENLATVSTPIFPGDAICLPARATMPSQPTSPAAPSSTVPATTNPPTTVPATTNPPTTNSPTTGPPPSSSEAEQIIRDVWPDELEQKALAIAWRESGYRANAYNGGCCYGLFQLHWTAHRSWLDDYGINTATDLFDAHKNTQAAYALYQSSGGWAPWGG
jgi:LysM repeat protein